MAKKKIIIIGRGGSGQNQDTPTDIAELQQQIQQLTAERNALSLQLSAAIVELEQANADVTTLTSEKVALQEAVDELNNQIAKLDEQITALNKRIGELEETIKNMGGDVPGGEIIPGGPHNPENDAFEEDFLWIENVDDTDGTITLNLTEAPFMYYSYDDDTDFQKIVTTNILSIPAHSKIYLRWKGKIATSLSYKFISNLSCNHNIGGELKNGGLKRGAYQYFFYDDTKLIDASQLKLSATTLAPDCYSNMFQNCTSLTTAPELPATKLGQHCYQYMFQNCTSLTTAPAILPADGLQQSCYSNMFQNCTSLTTAPELPATTLGQHCYSNMFQNCTSLTTAPELPATTLQYNCYGYMFQNCTSLTTAPELPATTLESNCYSSMFSGCSSLNYVKTNALSWSTSNTSNWLNGVATAGIVDTFPFLSIPENSVSGVPSGWTKQIDPNAKNTINIHNVSGLENTISIPNKFSAFKYKTNNDTEYTENPKTTALTITLQPDETLTINDIYYPSSSSSTFTGITSTENINVSGEVNYSIPYMFYCLFGYSKKLIDASQLKLSATTLAKNCYQYMFINCSSLTTAPELPATTLTSSCYNGMFSNCFSLTTAPELPATTLASSCYNGMFSNCFSLTTAPELPATTLASSCYNNMFYNCDLLTTAPELPAQILVSNCYTSMFDSCGKLNSITFLSTEPFIYNDSNAKNLWVQGVSKTGTFRTPIANKEWIENYPRSSSAVPSGWTIEYIE